MALHLYPENHKPVEESHVTDALALHSSEPKPVLSGNMSTISAIALV